MNNQLNDEINFTEIIKKIYNSRKIIIYITLIFVIIGIVISLLSPIKYSSSTIFIPQNQEVNSSSLSGVASLVGINLGNSYGKELPTTMYPKIAESPKFKRLILNKIIDSKKNLTLKEFIIENYKPKGKDFSNSSELYVSELEENCFEILSRIISISVNESDGFVTLSTEMSNAEYSALLANISKEILQKIIIENKIESAKQNLKFSEEQLAEKKVEFDRIQSKLSYFSDSNQNSVSPFVINERDKLEAEFQIINAVVIELSKQVEQSKLQVTKDTPVFSTIKEPVIPNVRTSPKRKLLVFTYSFFGFILSIFFILIKEPAIKFINKIKKS